MSDEEEIVDPEEESAEAEAEEAVATETAAVSKAKKAIGELKVVIILKANKAMLGVQSPDCDPVYKTMEGDLAAVLQVVPVLVGEAQLKWSAAPRYPKADLPKPVAPAATTTSSSVSKPTAKAAQAQPKFF